MRKRPITDAYIKKISEPMADDPQKRTYGEVIRDTLAEKAKAGGKKEQAELDEWNAMLKRLAATRKE